MFKKRIELGDLSVRQSLIGVCMLLLLTMAAIALHAQRGSVADIVAQLRTGILDQKKRSAWALGAHESREALPALLAALEDEDPEVRTLAAWALGEIKDPATIPALLEAVADDDLLVREMVVRSLGEMEQAQLTDRFVEWLEDPDPAIRATTVWSLGEIGDESALAAVRRSRSDADPTVKALAARILTTRDSQLEMQEKRVATDPEIREQVNRVLEETAQASDLRLLAARLGDDSPLVRSAAAYSLGKFGDPSIIDALIAALRDPHPDVRAMVVWALDEINIP